jgi:hypothetical protein
MIDRKNAAVGPYRNSIYTLNIFADFFFLNFEFFGTEAVCNFLVE